MKYCGNHQSRTFIATGSAVMTVGDNKTREEKTNYFLNVRVL
jgi:hypothetical protein